MQRYRWSHRQWIGIAIAVMLWSGAVHAETGASVVTLGANLTAPERQEMIRDFGSMAQGARMLTITHQDEVRLLSGIAPAAQIGTRSISSSAVTSEAPGYGIHVTTRNITWVTPAMYANALATAGVQNAQVTADAPFPVSGTAALAGILTAYQAATGSTIQYGQQRTAAKEMVVTGNLGQQIGSKSKAAALMLRTKNIVVSRHLSTAAAIRPVVINEANRLSISLTASQITEITNVMLSISRLSLNPAAITVQLKTWEQEAASVVPPGFWQQLLHVLQQIWQAIISVIHGNTAKA